MSNAFTFPGQGSQFVGMGAELAKVYARAGAVFDEVDDALGQNLTQLMWEGPEETLTLTENAQPALMAVSLAVMRVLEQATGLKLQNMARYVAGHSLGEYSALAAAGAFGIGDTARLLRIRGRAMQGAVPVGEGAMAALLGAELEDVRKLTEAASTDEVCEAANDNAPGQVVISGATGAVQRAVEMAPEYGARRAVPLLVSAPFHCALMQPAANAMAEALSEINISAPTVPLIANVTADEVNDPEKIRQFLIEQMTGMVRWRESVGYMLDRGVTRVYEIGAGRVLTGLARSIERTLDAVSIAGPEDIDAAVLSIASGD